MNSSSGSPERVHVQSAVHEALGEISERLDLAPREPRSSQVARIRCQQLLGRGQVPPKAGCDALDGLPGRRHGQLLTRDLKEKGSEQGHRRQVVQPRKRLEVWSQVNELPDHGVGLAKMSLGRRAKLVPVCAHPVEGPSPSALTVLHRILASDEQSRRSDLDPNKCVPTQP